jgi:hypothetical protein
MKKAFSLGAIIVFLFCFTVRAFPWGSAVHVYIADQLKAKMGQPKLNAMYGAMAPDIFNYDFSQQAVFLAKVMHIGSLAVWLNARTPAEKQLAYGFVSHNDIWGADSTAHHHGVTKYWGEGYVIGKAKILAGILKPILQGNNLDLPPDVLLEVCHNLIEDAIDVLITRVDNEIGLKVKDAALNRDPVFPSLLARSFWLDAGLMAGAEGQFQLMMSGYNNTPGYGDLLMLPEFYALEALTQQMAALSSGFLLSKGITPPPPSVLLPLIQFGHEQSVKICKNDYKKEIEGTIDRVGWLLKIFGMNY